ncbi:unnamed protein product [Lathyrus sativus]|nr:unnamed protein product [Lathyrus sativus]
MDAFSKILKKFDKILCLTVVRLDSFFKYKVIKKDSTTAKKSKVKAFMDLKDVVVPVVIQSKDKKVTALRD